MDTSLARDVELRSSRHVRELDMALVTASTMWLLESMTMQRQPDPRNEHDHHGQDNVFAKQAKHVVMS